MFDGSVDKTGRIIYSCVSYYLIKSAQDIWSKNNLKFGIRYDKNSKIYFLYSLRGNSLNCLLNYFEPETQKWKLLKWLDGDISKNPKVEDKPYSKLSFLKLYNFIKSIKSCDCNFLANKFNCKHFLVRYYLKTLLKQGKISLSKNPKFIITNYTDPKTYILLKNSTLNVLFDNIKEKFPLDKDLANNLKIHKATVSAWKTGKNRIPLFYLEKLCKLTNLKMNYLLSNIKTTDREIIELI